MPNGIHTFKFQGKTYGNEAIFSAQEAAMETYHAFGKEKTFLSKLLKQGFIVQGKFAFHPECWTPMKDSSGWHTHSRTSKRTGKKILGRMQAVRDR